MRRVTTVIPSYRRPLLLERAIRSVLNQTHEDLEVHVFDDASGDGTAELVQRFARRDSRVKYFCQSRNTGMMPNTAAAVDSVDSEFFTILNDDDFLAPDFFDTALRTLAAYPDAKVFVGRLIRWEESRPSETTTFSSLAEGYYEPPEAFFHAVQNDGTHTWTSMMFKREVLDGVGGVDQNVGYAADMDFELRVFAKYPVVCLDIPCAVYCVHPGSSSYAGWVAPCASSFVQMLKNIERDERLDPRLRNRMYSVTRPVLRDKIFRFAINALLRGECDDVGKVCAALDQELGSKTLATALRLSAAGSPTGRMSRATWKYLKAAKSMWRRPRDSRGSGYYIDFVSDALEKIRKQPNAEARP